MSLEEAFDATLGHDRVREHSARVVNERIDRDLRAREREYSEASVEQLGRRLGELDHEWHVDRALMANFAVAGGVSFTMALRHVRPWRKRSGWLYLFATQMSFLLVHAVAGWCPPVAVFRRLGFRTAREIAAERQLVLDALRKRTGEPSH